MNKCFRTTILISLLTTLVLCITPAASANESALDFRVSPGPATQVSEGGDYFVLGMEPGETSRQTVQLSNPSSSALKVRLAGVDAATAQMGGVDYGAEAVVPKAAGTWITFEEDMVELTPGGSMEVGFEVTVPGDAQSGVHLGGLVIWVEGAAQETVAGAQATMNVQSRRVIAVQVELPGPAAPALEIRGAEAEARPDGLYLGIDLFNSGNGFVKGTGTVLIEGRDEDGSFPLDTVVPRTGTTYPFRWAASSVPNGTYDVSVEIDYGSAIATWEGEVVVGAVVQDDLRGRGVDPSTGSSRQTVILVGIALVLGMFALFLRRRFFGHRSGIRLPRISIQAAPHPRSVQPRKRSPKVAPLRGGGQLAQAAFVPRSEELQRRVPPPPPPPPAGFMPPAPPPSGAGRAA